MPARPTTIAPSPFLPGDRLTPHPRPCLPPLWWRFLARLFCFRKLLFFLRRITAILPVALLLPGQSFVKFPSPSFPNLFCNVCSSVCFCPRPRWPDLTLKILICVVNNFYRDYESYFPSDPKSMCPH